MLFPELCECACSIHGITVLNFLNAYLQGCMKLIIGHGVSIQSRRSFRQRQREGDAASQGNLALGAVGVPVLANFSGGFDKFVGPTGGFLISFPLMAYIIGLGVEHRNAFKGAFVTAVVVGTLVNYVVGVALFVVVAHSTIAVGISACVLPFIPTAIIKAVLACAIGLNLRKRIPGLKA